MSSLCPDCKLLSVLSVVAYAIRHCMLQSVLHTCLAAAQTSNALITQRRLKAKMPVLAGPPHDLAQRHKTSLKAMVCRNVLTA